MTEIAVREDGFIYSPEAAEALGITRTTFNQRARDGKLPGAVRYGGNRGLGSGWKIRPEDLMPLLNGEAEVVVATDDPERHVHSTEIARRLGVSQATVNRRFNEGKFPVPVGQEPGRGGHGGISYITEADLRTLEGKEDVLGVDPRLGRTDGHGHGSPSKEEVTALELAEQLMATAQRLVRVLKRDQDQKSKVAMEVVKLFGIGGPAG